MKDSCPFFAGFRHCSVTALLLGRVQVSFVLAMLAACAAPEQGPVQSPWGACAGDCGQGGSEPDTGSTDVESECADGEDNDSDGATDCDDEDCEGDASCADE